MKYGVYRVIGRREYRGHAPGTVFEAVLDPGPEQRAIDRGDIKLLRHITPSLAPGSFTLPARWVDEPVQQATEVPQGASLIEGGG